MEDTDLPKQTRIEKIRSLLAKGRLEEALVLFEGTFLADEALGLLGRLRGLEEEVGGGVIRAEEADVRKNQIRKSALGLVRKLEKGTVAGRPLWVKVLVGVLGMGGVGLITWFIWGEEEQNQVSNPCIVEKPFQIGIAEFQEGMDPKVISFAEELRDNLENEYLQGADSLQIRPTRQFFGLPASGKEKEDSPYLGTGKVLSYKGDFCLWNLSWRNRNKELFGQGLTYWS